MNQYLIVVRGDTNDGDYITKTTLLSEKKYEKIENVLVKVSDIVANSTAGYNWANEYSDEKNEPEEQYVKTGKITQEELDMFSDYVPSGELGVHTVESVTVYTITEIKELL